jgi:hypothetical protein
MKEKSRTMNTVGSALVVALTLAGDAGAQATGTIGSRTAGGTDPLPHGTLPLGESGGQPKGYAFLMQVLPQGRTPQVSINLTPVDATVPPWEFTWEMTDPSDNGLKSLLALKWYGQAACPDNLTLLKVTGPGGTLTQNPLSNPIWGYFNAQSFSVDTVKGVCIDWANDDTCDPAEPGCVLTQTFELVGGVAPATPADILHLKASCASGPLPNLDYAPVLSVRCNRYY